MTLVNFINSQKYNVVLYYVINGPNKSANLESNKILF